MVVLIGDRRLGLWRAVDDEGEVLDLLVQRRRDARAAARLMRKLLKKQGVAPALLVTGKLRSYAAANAILFPATRSASSEVKPSRIGGRRRRLGFKPSPYCFLRPRLGSRDNPYATDHRRRSHESG
jgi:transposase-like protein